MLFWAFTLLILQLFLLIIVYLNFPRDNILVILYLMIAVNIILIVKGVKKTREHRMEKLESQVRHLLGEIEELREKYGSKIEEE